MESNKNGMNFASNKSNMKTTQSKIALPAWAAPGSKSAPGTTIARGMLTCLIRTLKDFFGLHFIRLQYSFVHDKN